MTEEPASLTAARQLAEESRAGRRQGPRRMDERLSDLRRLRQPASATAGRQRQDLLPAGGARRARAPSADDSETVLQDEATAGESRASPAALRGELDEALRHAERQGLAVRDVAALVPTRAGRGPEGAR